MQQCSLNYIPERLHQNDKLPINFFEVGEFLYRRCDKKDLDNPFKTISITELSHNRSGLKGNVFCNEPDVLFNINADEVIEKYNDKVVCVLEIKNLNENNTYKKTYTQEKNNITITA